MFDAQSFVAEFEQQDLVSGVAFRRGDSVTHVDFVTDLGGGFAGARCYLVVPDYFPAVAPKCFLKNVEQYPGLNHIDPKGEICLGRWEDVVLNRLCMEAALSFYVAQRLSELKAKHDASDFSDFYHELEAYWQNLPNVMPVASCLGDASTAGRIYYCVEPATRNTFVPKWIDGGGESALRETYVKNTSEYGGYLLPLDKPFRPGANQRYDRSLINQLLSEHLADDVRAFVDRQVRKAKACRHSLILFSQTSGNGERSVFGFWLSVKQGQLASPIGGVEAGWEVAPLSISRRNTGYLKQRGGVRHPLQGKHVAVFGLGSVGGHVPIQLAKAGLSNFTLCDPDTLNPENTYRHRLGLNHIGENKATATQRELTSQLAIKSVHVLDKGLEHYLYEHDFSLYDVVVLSIGNCNLELEANDVLRKRFPQLKVVFVWQEPFGAGGHALASSAGAHGCLECLFVDQAGGPASRCLANYLEPSPSSVRSLNGSCSGAFTPYGYQDALKTASLATDLILGLLTEVDPGPSLSSWRNLNGLPSSAVISSRGLMAVEQATGSTAEFVNSKCPACGAG